MRAEVEDAYGVIGAVDPDAPVIQSNREFAKRIGRPWLHLCRRLDSFVLHFGADRGRNVPGRIHRKRGDPVGATGVGQSGRPTVMGQAPASWPCRNTNSMRCGMLITTP